MLFGFLARKQRRLIFMFMFWIWCFKILFLEWLEPFTLIQIGVLITLFLVLSILLLLICSIHAFYIPADVIVIVLPRQGSSFLIDHLLRVLLFSCFVPIVSSFRSVANALLELVIFFFDWVGHFDLCDWTQVLPLGAWLLIPFVVFFLYHPWVLSVLMMVSVSVCSLCRVLVLLFKIHHLGLLLLKWYRLGASLVWKVVPLSNTDSTSKILLVPNCIFYLNFCNWSFLHLSFILITCFLKLVWRSAKSKGFFARCFLNIWMMSRSPSLTLLRNHILSSLSTSKWDKAYEYIDLIN